MTREQSAPQYFRKTLEDTKSMDHSNFLEVNTNLTGALPSSDLRTTIAKASNVFSCMHFCNVDTLSGAYTCTESAKAPGMSMDVTPVLLNKVCAA